MNRFALMENFKYSRDKGQLDIPVSLKSKAHMYLSVHHEMRKRNLTALTLIPRG